MARRMDKPPTGPSLLSPKKAVVPGDRGFAGLPNSATQGPSPTNSQLHRPSPTSPAAATTSLPSTPVSQSAGSMDKIKEKMVELKRQADEAHQRADTVEENYKKLDLEHGVTKQENASLQHRLGLLEADLEKAEAEIAALKKVNLENEAGRTTSDNLQRKVVLLEEELDASERNVKETVEKLRQVDIKAEHFERQVQRLEEEREQWEKRCEEYDAKYKKAQTELDELVRSMGDL